MLKYVLLLVLFASAITALTLKSNLQTQLSKNGNADVFIIFKEHVDFKKLEQAESMKLDDMDHSLRGKLVVSSLKAVAEKSQREVVAYLKANNVKYFSFWISNSISVEKATVSLLKNLDAQFAGIQSFELVDQATIIDEVKPEFNAAMSHARQTIEAGVKHVKAPEVWAKGFNGKGVTIGVIDTGAYLHADLKTSYRGRESGHSHNWLDATSLARPAPYDDNVHGTHCHGTITANSTRETVGVAPGADWVSCKFLTARGSGNYNDCVKCYQFMLAPTDSKGLNANSDKRPHVVSNSYGGGTPTAALERALDALYAAGVEMVFAAGNSGSRCSSILLPALYPQAISVGALNRNADTIASFSSRGPGRNSGLKPEISAPGAQVRSTDNRGGYRSLSGTSMACPHVAGVIALLWSARPELARKIKETRDILYATALKQTSNLCSSNGTPNNVFGHGTINSLKAVEAAEAEENATSLNKF